MAGDLFLKLAGVPGESKDHKHKGEIDIESWSWSMNQPAAFGGGGGGGAGKVNVSELNVSKGMDAASPKLMLYCCAGTHISDGLLTVRKAGDKPVEYLKIKLTDILISSVSHNCHGDRPSESLSLNFAKFQVEYTEQKEDGTAGKATPIGWDIKANIKV